MRHIVTSKWFMDQQKYPKSRMSIRIWQSETLDNIRCHTFPGMGGRTLRHSRAQFKFSFFFGPKILIEIPAHTIGFRVLLCIAMASNRILWFAPASITELGYFQVNLTSWPTRQAVSGGWRAAAGRPIRVCVSTRLVCVNWTATSSPLQVTRPGLFLNRARPGRSAAALASGRPASLRFNEIHVDNRPGRRRRHGGGGGRGWACAWRHQPPGTTVDIYWHNAVQLIKSSSAVVKATIRDAQGHGFEPGT